MDIEITNGSISEKFLPGIFNNHQIIDASYIAWSGKSIFEQQKFKAECIRRSLNFAETIFKEHDLWLVASNMLGLINNKYNSRLRIWKLLKTLGYQFFDNRSFDGHILVTGDQVRYFGHTKISSSDAKNIVAAESQISSYISICPRDQTPFELTRFGWDYADSGPPIQSIKKSLDFGWPVIASFGYFDDEIVSSYLIYKEDNLSIEVQNQISRFLSEVI